MIRDSDTSKDILQTVFIRVLEMDTFPDSFEDARRMLFTMSKNACMDTFRSKARFGKFRSRFHLASYQTDDDDKNNLFWDILSECSKTERSILYLHVKAGYSYAEISTIMDIGESAIRVKVCRAMKVLREKMLGRKKNEY
jgi:RNA polymerase sigma factor (sigma-70 family)